MKSTMSVWGLVMSFVVLGFFGLFNTDLPIGNENTVYVHTNLKNNADSDVDDLSLRAFFYDGVAYGAAQDFDLEDNSVSGRTIVIDHEATLYPDYYPVRIVAQNDDVRHVKHAWVWIG